jgi:hypothetical protein
MSTSINLYHQKMHLKMWCLLDSLKGVCLSVSDGDKLKPMNVSQGWTPIISLYIYIKNCSRLTGKDLCYEGKYEPKVQQLSDLKWEFESMTGFKT